MSLLESLQPRFLSLLLVWQVRSEECRCVSEVEGRTEDEKGNVGGRDEDGGSGVVFAGFCDDDCASLIPYILTLVAFVVAFSLYNAAATTTLLR